MSEITQDRYPSPSKRNGDAAGPGNGKVQDITISTDVDQSQGKLISVSITTIALQGDIKGSQH